MRALIEQEEDGSRWYLTPQIKGGILVHRVRITRKVWPVTRYPGEKLREIRRERGVGRPPVDFR